MTDTHRSTRKAFTLIEVLVALSLASLLLVALQHVIRGLVDQQRAASEITIPEPWVRRLRSRIEWDLQNSTHIRVNSAGFVLQGEAFRNELGVAVHLPVFVTYRVDGEYLMRTSTRDRDDAIATNEVRELMAQGVTRVLIGRFDDTVPDLLIPVPARNQFFRISSAQKVILLSEENVIDEFVVNH